MAYADYEYYAESFYGTLISDMDFPRMAERASAYIDYITMGRAAKNADLPQVKKACCALAEQYQMIEAAQAAASKALLYAAESTGAELKSQTVGGWSKTYRSGGESAGASLSGGQNAKDALMSTAQMYLTGTGLLYRGGRCCDVSAYCDAL